MKVKDTLLYSFYEQIIIDHCSNWTGAGFTIRSSIRFQTQKLRKLNKLRGGGATRFFSSYIYNYTLYN